MSITLKVREKSIIYSFLFNIGSTLIYIIYIYVISTS